MPDTVTGVLLTSVAPAAKDALAEGDVLTHIDGRRIADDGQVTLRGDELILCRYAHAKLTTLHGTRVDARFVAVLTHSATHAWMTSAAAQHPKPSFTCAAPRPNLTQVSPAREACRLADGLHRLP